jgi:hypothetical protein
MTISRWRGARAVVLAGLAALLCSCGGSATPSGSSSGGAQPSAGAGGSAATTLTVGGAVGGTLSAPGAACVDLGSAGFQVAITGALAGANYVLKFNAPGGTTDLSAATTADIVVLFLQLPSGPSWQADPRAGKGTGTINVNGTTGGAVNLHLVPSAGSSGSGVDLSGAYTCSSKISE